MGSSYKDHTSYLIIDQVCSHVFDEHLSEADHDEVLRIFKSKGGNWVDVVNGNPEQMQKLIMSIKSFMKSSKKSQKRVQ